MLTNHDLEELGKHYNLPIHDTVMKDELRGTPQEGHYIINLDSSNNSNGTHWTCLTRRGKQFYFFDSFGAPPSVEVVEFVKKVPDSTLGFNNCILQDLDSENCGYFCIGNLLKLQKSPDIYTAANRYINTFFKNTKRNDKVLQNYFRKLRDNDRPTQIERLLKE